MKQLILFSYLVTVGGCIVYFYYRIGFLKMLATLTLDELNKEQEFSEEKLEERDFNSIRNFFVGAFSLLGVYLWSLIGTTFGMIAREMATSSTLKWILYPLFFIMMGTTFGMAHRLIKERFDIEGHIQGNFLFAMSMITFFILSICYPEWVSVIFSWPVSLALWG